MESWVVVRPDGTHDEAEEPSLLLPPWLVLGDSDATAAAVLKAVSTADASAAKDLYLKDSSMRDMMTSMVMQALGRPLERVNVFARVVIPWQTY